MRKIPLLAVFCVTLCFIVSCSQKPAEVIITVINSVGNVKIISENGERTPQWGEALHRGETVITADNAMVDLQYSDMGLIRISENSRVVMAMLYRSSGKEQSQLTLAKGRLFSTMGKFKKGSSFEVHTSTAVAAVRGTSIRVSAGKCRTQVDVLKGKVSLRPSGTLQSRNSTITSEGISVQATAAPDKTGTRVQFAKNDISNQDRIAINDEIRGLHDAKTKGNFSTDVIEELQDVINENVSCNIEVESSPHMVMERSRDIRSKKSASSQ